METCVDEAEAETAVEEAWVAEDALVDDDSADDEAGSELPESLLESPRAAGPGILKLLKLSDQMSGHWTFL